LCFEELGDLAVAKRLLWVFFRNQFFDQSADGGSGYFSAGICGYMTRKEVLQLE
jgi:hypothetical protein